MKSLAAAQDNEHNTIRSLYSDLQVGSTDDLPTPTAFTAGCGVLSLGPPLGEQIPQGRTVASRPADCGG